MTAIHFASKRTPNEAPWTPPFQAECSGGHSIRAERPVKACPACVHGQPCEGELRRFGQGSRSTSVANSMTKV